MYTAFSDDWWESGEPRALRPPHPIRIARLVNRAIRPSFSLPDVYWIKAVHVPTNTLMGAACWAGPTHPPGLYCFWRKSADAFYNWPQKYNWSEADIEEMWSHTTPEVWVTQFDEADRVRKEKLGDEPHWYLAPLFVRPEFQKRGVSSKLLAWAIEQADKTEPATPLYLEASKMGRPVYEHVGFVAVGEKEMLRRGPKKQNADSVVGDKSRVEIAVQPVGEDVA